MTTREELLNRLWHRINSYVTPYYIGRVLVRDDDLDETIERCQQIQANPSRTPGPPLSEFSQRVRRDKTCAWFFAGLPTARSSIRSTRSIPKRAWTAKT